MIMAMGAFALFQALLRRFNVLFKYRKNYKIIQQFRSASVCMWGK